MYTGLLHLHNFMRWVILILLIVALVRHYAGYTNKKPFSARDKKIDLFLMISAHITLLIGLYQWIAGPWGLKNISSNGMGQVMKQPVQRFFAVEHLVGMLIAIALITIGRGVAKKAISDTAKHKKAFWMFLVALVIIVISIPWPGREAARPLFPGM
jgi:hypothetical protein